MATVMTFTYNSTWKLSRPFHTFVRTMTLLSNCQTLDFPLTGCLAQDVKKNWSTDSSVGGRKNGWMDGWMEGWMDGGWDGWMYDRTDGRMDGRMGGWKLTRVGR